MPLPRPGSGSTGIGAALRRRRAPWPPAPRVEPPPPAPAGWEPGPPSFVGIGAPRCSTTRWFRLIRQHPDVAWAEGARKETQFLSQFAVADAPDRVDIDYARYFPRPSGGVAGEWSPDYLAQYWVPPLLQRLAPAARLLVLLRDPVERYLSTVAYQRARGAPDHHLVATDAFTGGLYATHLDRWWAQFAPEQILVLQLETCVADAAGQLARTYAFLGLDPTFVPPDLHDVIHRGRGDKPELNDARRHALVEGYRADVARLASEVDGFDAAAWPHFADRV